MTVIPRRFTMTYCAASVIKLVTPMLKPMSEARKNVNATAVGMISGSMT